MLNILLKKKFMNVTLKDGSLKFWSINCIYEYRDSGKNGNADNLDILDSYTKDLFNGKNVEFLYNGKKVLFSSTNITRSILEVFFAEDYINLNPQGEIVIDIGANIGDTGLYFALNGADRVIALEPYINTYKLAINNIDLNSLNDKITLLNAGYGEDSEVGVNPETIADGTSLLVPSKNGVRVRIYSLKTLLHEYKIEEAVLKIDCEGCEYNLLKEENYILKKFKRIELEFHYGYKNLVAKLTEAGFDIKILKVFESDGTNTSLKKMAINNNDYTFGLLYAQRI